MSEHENEDFEDSHILLMERRIRALETELKITQIQRDNLDKEREDLKRELQKLRQQPFFGLSPDLERKDHSQHYSNDEIERKDPLVWRLTPNILLRDSTDSTSVIFETIKGVSSVDATQLTLAILTLLEIRERLGKPLFPPLTKLLRQLDSYLKREHSLRRFFESNPHFLENLSDYFSQIEAKASARLGSRLRKTQGVSAIDPPEYWEALRDLAKLGKEQASDLQDPRAFIEFLEQASLPLSKVSPEEIQKRLLEELLNDEEE